MKKVFPTVSLFLATFCFAFADFSMAYERITHGDNRFNDLLTRAKSAGAISEIWADRFIQKTRSFEGDISAQINKKEGNSR